MEVQTVNSTVPFMFISNFTPLLKNAAKVSKNKRSFVVNVTSAEGIFNMNKRGIHPHTNMAKAALNMMTKSISTPFAAMNIFATALGIFDTLLSFYSFPFFFLFFFLFYYFFELPKTLDGLPK